MPTIVLVAGTKGGVGKSTVALHLIAGLLERGLRVGAIDADLDQGVLIRFAQARKDTLPFANPLRAGVDYLMKPDPDLQACQVIVVDTPAGMANPDFLKHADVLVCPTLDSFIDVDLFVTRPPAKQTEAGVRDNRGGTSGPGGPGVIAEAVHTARKVRARNNKGTLRWLVVRNRIHSRATRQHRLFDNILLDAAPRFGFEMVEGMRERILYRESFFQGRTVLDQQSLSLATVAARQEIRHLVDVIVRGPASNTPNRRPPNRGK